MRRAVRDCGRSDAWAGARLGAIARADAAASARHVHAEIDIGEPGRPVAVLAFLAAMLLVTGWEFATWGTSPTSRELSMAGGAGAGAIATGAWWKLLAANLLHANVAHVLMNAFVVLLMGRWLEHLVGSVVVAATILWSGLLASAGALVVDAAAVTIGASGVAFGLVGCAIACDPRARTATGVVARQFAVVNVIATFLVPGISIGGHLGGLAAGLLVGAACAGRGLPLDAARRVGRGALLRARLLVVASMPIIALAAAGPVALPDRAAAFRAAVVAPLLERQLAGATLTSGRRIETAACDGGRDPTTYRCVVDGESVLVRFSRTDDHWSLVSRE